MFNKNANVMFNNKMFRCWMISNMSELDDQRAMHPTMQRLYQAAKELRNVEGQSAVAKLMNISAQRVNNWEARGISAEGMLDAESVIGCSALWLRDGQGNMEASMIPGQAKVIVAEAGDPGFYQIPKVTLRLSAGMTGFQTVPEIYDGSTLSVPRNWVDRHGFTPLRLIAIPVKGESMEPGLYDGDMVIVNTADTTMADGGVFAVNYEGEAVIKRVTRDAGQWWLSSDNPDQRKFYRKSCRGAECIMIGRVVKKESERL